MEFINYEPGKGITTATYRNNGISCDNEAEFIERLINEKSVTVDVDDSSEFIKSCINALEDGEFLANFGYTDEESVSNAHDLLTNSI